MKNAHENLLGLISNCRVCGNVFFAEPLLRFKNMPKAAQHMPDEASLANDKGVDLEVCQCSGCGLVQLSNKPVPYYREVIRAAAFSEEMKAFRIEQFTDFVNKYSLRGNKVLEIGCGKGEYLSLMQQCGADSYGIEYAEESVTYCIRSGLKVTQGFIEKDGSILPDAPFAAFFILNFLEHLPDLNSILRGIYDNLSVNAVGLVEVPNFDMILKNKLFSEFIGDHLFYFTRETLESILNRNGFEVLECKVVWHDYIISAVVKKRSPLDLSSFAGLQLQFKEELQGFISQFGEKRVAVWGAGHQALAILALTDLAEKVRYVVDSAPFKQGKLTPATHIPIFSPDVLNSDPVDAVIIMAASYSEEVANILRQDFSKRMSLMIVKDFGLVCV
ncbi:MAG: class I SAM-dependent methyltransferase [Desulfuromonadaceae bacterium]|nr:class I SAM-dependent methyltransferase [Desulfuromonadaceae bacterium]